MTRRGQEARCRGGTPPPPRAASGPRAGPASRYLSYVDEAVLASNAVGLREAAGDFDCPVVGVDARPAHGEQACPEQRQHAQQVQPSRAAAVDPPAHGPRASLPPSLARSAHSAARAQLTSSAWAARRAAPGRRGFAALGDREEAASPGREQSSEPRAVSYTIPGAAGTCAPCSPARGAVGGRSPARAQEAAERGRRPPAVGSCRAWLPDSPTRPRSSRGPRARWRRRCRQRTGAPSAGPGS